VGPDEQGEAHRLRIGGGAGRAAARWTARPTSHCGAPPSTWRPSTPPGGRTAAATFYAVGCMLYLLLTGRLPFSSESTEKLQALHAHAPIPPLDLPEGSNVPPLMEDVVKRAIRQGARGSLTRRRRRWRGISSAWGFGLKRKGWQRWLPL
jgi:serine/threonine protein kinase